MEAPTTGRKTRLENFIELAETGQKVRILVNLFSKDVKQLGQTEETDDVIEETDMCLLMADFIPKEPAGEAGVSKVYMVSPIDEAEVDAKITRFIANERLKMDYKRLQEVNIEFEEKYF